MKLSALTTITLVLLLFSCFSLGRTCGHDDRVIINADKHVVDSMQTLLDSTHQADVVAIDEAFTQILSRDSTIRANEKERDNLKARVYVASKMGDHYADLYFEAQAAKDTTGMLASCDSAVQNLLDLEVAARDEIATADSTIALQREQGAVKDTLIARLRMDNMTLYGTGRALGWKYDDLDKRYRKRANWFHRWGLPVLTGVAGGLLVHALK
jgi:hypothetical protein